MQSKWLQASVFVLFGQPCKADCQADLCVWAMAEIESSCSRLGMHCLCFVCLHVRFELHDCDLNDPYKHVEETRPQLWLWNNM